MMKEEFEEKMGEKNWGGGYQSRFLVGNRECNTQSLIDSLYIALGKIHKSAFRLTSKSCVSFFMYHPPSININYTPPPPDLQLMTEKSS